MSMQAVHFDVIERDPSKDIAHARWCSRATPRSMITRRVCRRISTKISTSNNESSASSSLRNYLKAYDDTATVKHKVQGFATRIVTTLSAERIANDC